MQSIFNKVRSCVVSRRFPFGEVDIFVSSNGWPDGVANIDFYWLSLSGPGRVHVCVRIRVEVQETTVPFLIGGRLDSAYYGEPRHR